MTPPWRLILCCHIIVSYRIALADDKDTTQQLWDAIDRLEQLVGTLSRQLMMQQFYVEEQTRANGNSGIKQMRAGKFGTRPYHSASHVDGPIAAMHDHANTIRTIGLGELIAVLNGIEFRTRHNDYKLAMKSTTSSEYGATEEIPLPGVPPEVLQYTGAAEQAAEMREWFKAWRDQDHSVRDYRPYFKPVICYMEGMWTHSDQNDLDESFDSDRHFIDAKSWLDLQDKIRFTSYAGTKDSLENFAYLPTTILTVNGTTPILVQWNYRILCHAVSKDIPLNRLKVVDDLKTRIAHGLTLEEYTSSRAVRFQLGLKDQDRWVDKRADYGLLDELMAEIPGHDNYPGHIEDDLMGDEVYPFDSSERRKLNVARYHRAYRVVKKGANGLKFRHRGFSDENLFLAQTTNPKVAGLSVERCRRRSCEEWFQRWSYAIPLEIVYMTPLSSWNPYDIEYKGSSKSAEGLTVTQGPNGDRNGRNRLDKAYNGTNSKIFYRTPYEFFEDGTQVDPADTTEEYTHVLDIGGNIRRTRASGMRISIPNIPGVGSLRQRYPIMPIHGEGSALWKEVAALKDTMMTPSNYKYMFPEEKPITGAPGDTCVRSESLCDPTTETTLPRATNAKLHFRLGAASSEHGSHTHNLELSEDEAERFRAGETVAIVTEEADGHSHELRIAQIERGGATIPIVRSCDLQRKCWDGHARRLVPIIE